MSRQRQSIDLGGPLLREREGCRLTERSLSSRLAEIADRLAFVAREAAPPLPPEAWSLICWIGWDALALHRIADHPSEVDALAWTSIWTSIHDWVDGQDIPPAWTAGLLDALRNLSPIERVAVLERIEAYGRTQAMERSP